MSHSVFSFLRTSLDVFGCGKTSCLEVAGDEDVFFVSRVSFGLGMAA